MKYAVISFVILILSSGYWINSKAPEQKQQVKVYGKVSALQGKVIIKIGDKYLNLAASDRFSLFVNINPLQHPLIMEVTLQPKNQHCKLLSNNQDITTVNLKVQCIQMVTNEHHKNIATL